MVTIKLTGFEKSLKNYGHLITVLFVCSNDAHIKQSKVEVFKNESLIKMEK